MSRGWCDTLKPIESRAPARVQSSASRPATCPPLSMAACPHRPFILVLLPLALPNEFFGATIRVLGLKPDESFYWGNAIARARLHRPRVLCRFPGSDVRFASILGLIFGGISTALVQLLAHVLPGLLGLDLWAARSWGTWGTTRFSSRSSAASPSSTPGYRPFLLAIAWCGYEYFKSIGFLGYPWGLIAYPSAASFH